MSSIDKYLRNINSWQSFWEKVQSLDRHSKGDLFERLTQLVLLTKPEYLSLIKNVWRLRDEVPTSIKIKLNLPNSDEGIDLIAETNNEEYWAIQCKFKGDNSAPTYREISTFGNLAHNYCKNISQSILVHTGEKGVKKKKLLGDFFTQIGLDFWLNTNDEDWNGIKHKLKNQSIRPSARIARPHQLAAIQSATNHFTLHKNERGRLIMPCGTGKSLTAFWIAKSLKAKTIIVAVPSLYLIKQNLEDWTKEFLALNESPTPQWICICSDQTTGKIENDDFFDDTYSLGIPTTTNSKKIELFLLRQSNAKKIIFTTYQSSPELAKAAKKLKFPFDLAILDEAHKTVGVKSKSFATLLSDNNINISKRIFMTATERIIRGSNDEVFSMDNEKNYGKRFYHLNFKDAIHSKPPIICDYKILTVAVSNEEIQTLINRNNLVTDETKNINEQEAQFLASAVALRKAYEKYKFSHAISFHRSISQASNFANLNSSFNNINLYTHINSNHISSKKNATERSQLIKDFTNCQKGLLTNARCLTEGINIPIIDCVLFADPKQSVTEIVQAAGRALRPVSNKQFGYIMLPIIVPDNTTFDEFVDSTSFRQVAKVIAALSTQDERIAEEYKLSDFKKRSDSKRIIIEGTVPIGLKIDLKEFARKINTKIWTNVAKINYMAFEEARNFARTLRLKSGKEWKQFCISGNKPEDMPSKPYRTYKNKGWISMGNWLGTGSVAYYLKEYRSFFEARKYARSLKLKNVAKWLQFCKLENKPDDIPANPISTYQNKGWISWGDWLGTGTIAPRLRKYTPFLEARQYIHSLELKNIEDWRKFCNSGAKPENIPANPNGTYKNTGWLNWGDWLGTFSIANYLKEYRPFDEARKFVHSLKLENGADWKRFCRSENKPEDIPSKPYQTYKNKGWVGMADWLWTDAITSGLREYRSFDDAKKYVHSLKLKSYAEWSEFCKSGEKPSDIPKTPSQVYKNKGWKSTGDWLGTDSIATKYFKYRSFSEARKFAHSLKLKNGMDWKRFCKTDNKPEDIPSKPYRVYKDSGWISLIDWLGNNSISSSNREYKSFTEAKKYVHSLKLKSQTEWTQFSKSDNKPKDIPATPYNFYKNKGWISWGDWLGTGNIAQRYIKYRPFIEARKYARSLNLKTGKEWKNFCKSDNKPNDIPNDPRRAYKLKGWVSTGDWLGTGSIAHYLKKFRSFNEAKKYAQSLNLKTGEEWYQFCKSANKPDDIPNYPKQTYKSKGYISMGDWLGTGSIAKKNRVFKSFRDARKYVHDLNFETIAQWRQFCKLKKNPEDIPTNPNRTYKKEGWVNWGDWLGSGTVAPYLKEFKSFIEARDYARSLTLQNVAEWNQFCKSGIRPKDIPANPSKTYKKEGWLTWVDWLGK